MNGIHSATLVWLRLTGAPVAGYSLTAEDGIAGTKQHCLMAVGISYLHGRTVAVTSNGRDYFSAIPIRNREGAVLLFSMRWGLGQRHWVQTGEWAYPLLGPFEVDVIEVPENRRAWRWKEAARAALLALFEESSPTEADGRLVWCGTLYNWSTLRKLVGG